MNKKIENESDSQNSKVAEFDHRKLGEELDLFFFHESAPGMPYWLPKGLKVRNLLVQYWREYHEREGYQEIASPLLNKEHLWKISGHLEHFRESMFRVADQDAEQNEDSWMLKPMNCANAMIVWKRRLRSYRELPLRLSDSDLLHRNEASGALMGLFRSRCFCQDDSHNFVSEEQIGSEIRHILGIVKDFYEVFGLHKNLSLFLSLRPDEFLGEASMWDRAEQELRFALESSGIPFGIKPRDGAFYGPKIDIHLRDGFNREWQCGTIQLDFQLPRRFELEYADNDGSRKIPVVVHRAVYGSIERFLGIVIEHFHGRLPLWCAPVQLRVLEVGEGLEQYRERIVGELASIELSKPVRHNRLRYEVDKRNESLSRKISDAQREKVPLLAVIGAKERDSDCVVLRALDVQKVIARGDLHAALLRYAEVGEL